MRLYHGSTVVVKRPNIQKGRKATDFGRGFYTTTNFEQAKKWALLKKNREQSDRAIVSVYEVPDNILEGEFVVRHFAGATKEWLEFVVNNRKGKSTEEFVIKSKDKLFDSFCVEVFFNAFSDEKIHMIDNETLDTMLWKKVPRIKLELNFAQIKAIADLFAHIVDYKSPFTSNHSMGVAEGAEKISRFMGFDKDICQKMYIAGALHDIGKVAIGNEILEKPEKLTDEEFKTMKHHAVL